MRTQTYVLQCGSVAGMLATTALGHMAAQSQNWPLVAINTILFCANMGLFIWQRRIRSNLK